MIWGLYNKTKRCDKFLPRRCYVHLYSPSSPLFFYSEKFLLSDAQQMLNDKMNRENRTQEARSRDCTKKGRCRCMSQISNAFICSKLSQKHPLITCRHSTHVFFYLNPFYLAIIDKVIESTSMIRPWSVLRENQWEELSLRAVRRQFRYFKASALAPLFSCHPHTSATYILIRQRNTFSNSPSFAKENPPTIRSLLCNSFGNSVQVCFAPHWVALSRRLGTSRYIHTPQSYGHNKQTISERLGLARDCRLYNKASRPSISVLMPYFGCHMKCYDSYLKVQVIIERFVTKH